MTDKQSDKQTDKQLSGWGVAVETWCWLDVIASIISIFGH
jgi:hypothetical protein